MSVSAALRRTWQHVHCEGLEAAIGYTNHAIATGGQSVSGMNMRRFALVSTVFRGTCSFPNYGSTAKDPDHCLYKYAKVEPA